MWTATVPNIIEGSIDFKRLEPYFFDIAGGTVYKKETWTRNGNS
jgi:hypothetical protein